MAHDGKVWFITGCSRGFGRVWAEAALERGDRVVATARDVDRVTDLVARYGDAVLPLALDVTDRVGALAAVGLGRERFGRLDVVVNNAGYGLFGAVEEISEAQARAQLETNLLGPLWVTQAALPILRAQGRGHIIQISSVGGVVAYPMVGLYNASKWGLEAFSEALAGEVAADGIHVTIVEPGPYGTGWETSSSVWAASLPAYREFRAERRALIEGHPPLDPHLTVPAMFAIVDADEPPSRLFLGTFPYEVTEATYAERLDTWRQWRHLAASADPGSPGGAGSVE